MSGKEILFELYEIALGNGLLYAVEPKKKLMDVVELKQYLCSHLMDQQKMMHIGPCVVLARETLTALH